MKNKFLPENGASVRFKRKDEDEWKEGEYDSENDLFIETYSPEIITHNRNDILEWEDMEM